MDAAALQLRVTELEGLMADLSTELEASPEVLVRPAFDQVGTCHREMLELLAAEEASEGLPEGSAAASAEADVSLTASFIEKKSHKIAETVVSMRAQIDNNPWLDPPKLRKLRQAGDALAQAIADLRKLRRELAEKRAAAAKSAKSALARYSKPLPTYAGAMANAVVPSGREDGRTGAMDVDEALALLLEKKQGGYRGGLVGIVHAAGVQEMVPIPSHSPGKFEFVFAPKCAAAYNLHQFSAMI